MATIIIMLLLMTAIIVFLLQNSAPVAVSFLFWQTQASLAVVIFLTAVAGVLIGILLSSFAMLKRAARKKPQKADETTRREQ